MRPEYDVVVVGAGPAGSAASLALAKKGASVLMVEKGRVPGEANVSGGVLYGDFPGEWGLGHLVPDYESAAPLERRIMSNEVVFLGPTDQRRGISRYYRLSKSSVFARVGVVQLGSDTGHDYSVLRRPFDQWFSESAAKAGCTLSTETTVQGLIIEGGSVVGIRTHSEELRANLVIDASGVASTLASEAGLRKQLTPRQLYHGIKRVFMLDPKKIEERFRVRPGDGRAISYVGDFLHGMGGWGFIITNKESLSVGLVVPMDSLVRQTTEHFEQVGKLVEVLDDFQAHPLVAELLEGSTAMEFSSHNLPKGYRSILKRPYSDGFLVAGDALGSFVKIGLLMDGIRMAITSGMMAAAAYTAAAGSGSFRAKNLSRYGELLTPIFEDVNRSGRDSFLTESSITNNTLPRIMFAMRLSSVQKFGPRAPESRIDVSTRMEEEPDRAGMNGDKSSNIRVDLGLASKSLTKPWVPACPTSCFSIVTPKGTFSSFRDLYGLNLSTMGNKGKARAQTFDDIASGKLQFDGTRCVGCGTCGAIGPQEMVEFKHEDGGDGVRYEFG